jgi:hypothetical protein
MDIPVALKILLPNDPAACAAIYRWPSIDLAISATGIAP